MSVGFKMCQSCPSRFSCPITIERSAIFIERNPSFNPLKDFKIVMVPHDLMGVKFPEKCGPDYLLHKLKNTLKINQNDTIEHRCPCVDVSKLIFMQERREEHMRSIITCMIIFKKEFINDGMRAL